MSENFTIQQLDYRMRKALNAQNITELTEIQSLCIPQIIEGHNVSGGAKTGTGKTLAYLIPVYEYLLKLTPEQTHDFACVIAVPAKELAFQISRQIELLSDNLSFNAKAVVAIDKDNFQLSMELKKCFYRDVQTLFFTATYGEKYRKNLEKTDIEVMKLSTSRIVSTPESIKHYYVVCQHRDKNETVRKVIKASNATKAIIFANKRYDIDEITQKLKYHNYKVDALHAEGNKFRNKNIVKDFMSGRLQYVVASDYAARGMHFDDVDVIININLPEESTEYVHRAGRCGRNGKAGMCISIITDGELNKVKKFQKDLSINMVERSLYQGRLVAK